MTLPSNGITSDVMREMMPPYHLGTGWADEPAA
jgi:hypothetical protein